MGTKVQFENYLPAHYSMKDLTRESNGASWPCFGESNGQFYYGFLPRTVADSHPGYDKDVMKQTMLEHEAIFKDQVSELHRLYRVQRDMMDEVRRKEQTKQRIPYETSSSSSPVPSQMQYEDVQRWNGQNLPLSNSACGRPPISAPESSPYSAKGKSIQASTSSFPNCYSPKNSESESRPTKLRRRMFDLQLPADEYDDTDEVEQFTDVKVSNNMMSPSPDKNRKFTGGNGKLFMEFQGDTSRSDLHVSKPRALADLNEPLNVEEATSVDFLRRGQCDVQYREVSARSRLISSSSDVPQNGSMNGTLNNVHLENRSNGVDWLCYALESENKGRIRSINQGTCPEKVHVPSQPVHIRHDQTPAFLTSDRVNGSPWKAKSASHLPNQSGFFHPSDLGKSWDQCTSSWGNPCSFLGQKPIPVQRSPYPTCATLSKSPQSPAQNHNLFGNYKWNLNSSPSALGNETPVKNGFYKGNSINNSKGINVNPMRDMNLNMALPNGDHFSQKGVRIIDKSEEDPVAVLPWLRGKGACNNNNNNNNNDNINNEAENSRKGLNSLLSRWGSSVASNSCEGDVKAQSRKILGVPIFDNPPTPKKKISNPLIIHNCSGNKESGFRGNFDMNLPCDPTEEEEVVIVEEKIHTSIIHHFDLNSCLTEEEIPSTSVLENRNSIRIDTGIDLESPAILEVEDEDSSIKEHNNADDELELAKSAAVAIMSLNQSEEAPTCLQVQVQVETELDDPLEWFVDIACSDIENGDRRLPVAVTGEGLDDFELMTLRQKECSVEEYFPKPSFPEVPNIEEKGGKCMLTTSRARKGHGRRGRQRRDFQRDILPGLTTLSRHEVTEDLQMFGGLMRATGHPWQSGPNRTRNGGGGGCGRGRRRAVVAAPNNTVLKQQQQQQHQLQKNNDTQVILEDRSLTGWGKTTRRPRRQRCPAGTPPLPLT
ncbi:uncharacterized protein [Spinacia oleracea]|nr:uncharacterized protein LOC110779088 isoform X2 [Spinacia oleracea]XP_056697099.1 uncharacterized protein LOC110779088 isoform X2 [Spinacia oleracea]